MPIVNGLVLEFNNNNNNNNNSNNNNNNNNNNIMTMIMIIVNNDNINCCEKTFSTGLFLQFTFSYSITTAIEHSSAIR